MSAPSRTSRQEAMAAEAARLRSRKKNKLVLARIERDGRAVDPAGDEERCEGLRIMDCRRQNHPLAHHEGTSMNRHEIKDNIVSNDNPSYFDRLGTAIGHSTLLRELEFCGGVTSATAGHVSSFFQGLKRNSSGTKLTLRECNLSEPAALDLLNALGEEGCNLAANLEKLYVYNCSVGNDTGAVALSNALGNCGTNMTGLELTQTDVSQWLWELVPGLRACRNITSLKLGGLGMPHIDRAGCEALVPLLQDTSSIRNIELWVDDTNYGCTKVLAGALANNKKVENFSLCGNVGMRAAGWDAFSRLLCDTSSIEKTYHSNHTLYYLGGEIGCRVPDNVSTLLRINSRLFDKKQIAIQKVLLYHPTLDMKPFFEWEMKVFPTALGWLDKARPLTRGIRVDIDALRLGVIYQFIRGLPEALELPSTGGKKRKLNE